ncbi:MAG: hypothetical protein ACK5MR_10125 [Cumulibacter sp.]
MENKMKYKRFIPKPTEYEEVDTTIGDVIELMKKDEKNEYPHGQYENVKYKNFMVNFT